MSYRAVEIPEPATAAARCADLSRTVGESTHATTPEAVAWLVVEQSGPWGADAVRESRLDPAVGRALVDAARGAGVRILLMRRRDRAPGQRRVILSFTHPSAPWAQMWDEPDVRSLCDIDFRAVASGVRPGLGDPLVDPVVLVCANAKRDQCCAISGGPLANALSQSHPDGVWESSHLGGHRFAPTMLVLPTGYAYGRLGLEEAEGVLDAARVGRVGLDGIRGRSTWSREGQMAEIAVRLASGEPAANALVVQPVASPLGGGASLLTVTHVDGRAWHVDVATEKGPAARPEACGREAIPVVAMRARAVRRIA